MCYTEIKNDIKNRFSCGRYWSDCMKTLAMQGFS